VIAPGVTFDAVAVLVPGGDSFVTLLDSNVTTPIPASDVTFSGNDLMATVSASLLPSLGSAFTGYTVNLWPRSELAFTDDVIADFAPDNSNASISAIPEPVTMALVGSGLGMLLIFRRLRRSPAATQN